MLFQVPSYYEVKQKLLERGTSYLYSNPFPTTHTIIKQRGIDQIICVDGLLHSCRLEEKRYGKAIMITKICKICDYGDVEVFPPNENREMNNE